MSVKVFQVQRALLRHKRDIVDLQNTILGCPCQNVVTPPGTVAAPILAPSGGGYSVSFNVTMASLTPGATIYYTLDGSTPTILSTEYTAPIFVDATVTIKAFAVLSGLTDSAVTTETYTMSSLLALYWGYSPSTTLNEAGVLALQNTANGSNPFRQYIFDAGSTASDYFFWWWPATFSNPGTTDGFEDDSTSSPLSMATTTEGFTGGPVNGWYFLNVTVGGVAGRLWRSFYPIGGGPNPFTTNVNS